MARKRISRRRLLKRGGLKKRHSKRHSKRRGLASIGPGCCPVIRLKCKMTKPRTSTFAWVDPYSGETKKSKFLVAPRRVCAVALGDKVVTTYGPPNRAGRRINAFRKQLAARNCNVKVNISQARTADSALPTAADVTVKGPKPPPAVEKRLKGKALKQFLTSLKSMY